MTVPDIKTGLNQGLAWITQGWHLIRKQPSRWLGMAVVYLAFGFVLTRIPFMGALLLVLVTPMLLASAVWHLGRENDTAPPQETGSNAAPATGWLQDWLVRPAQELISIFSQEEQVFGAVLLGIVTLGLTMVVKIIGYLFIGGSMLSGLAAGPAGAVPLSAWLGMGVLTILHLLLTMGLFFSVPLTVLHKRQPFEAIAESFSICRGNAVPLLAMTAPFYVAYLGVAIAFNFNHWLGYLLLFGLGIGALPLFMTSVYSSYQSLFPPATHGTGH